MYLLLNQNVFILYHLRHTEMLIFLKIYTYASVTCSLDTFVLTDLWDFFLKMLYINYKAIPKVPKKYQFLKSV